MTSKLPPTGAPGQDAPPSAYLPLRTFEVLKDIDGRTQAMEKSAVTKKDIKKLEKDMEKLKRWVLTIVSGAVLAVVSLIVRIFVGQ